MQQIRIMTADDLSEILSDCFTSLTSKINALVPDKLSKEEIDHNLLLLLHTMTGIIESSDDGDSCACGECGEGEDSDDDDGGQDDGGQFEFFRNWN